MIASCSFSRMSVPDIIRWCKRELERYPQPKEPNLLRDVMDCLEEGRKILGKALVAAGANDRKRIAAITARRREIDELQTYIKKL